MISGRRNKTFVLSVDCLRRFFDSESCGGVTRVGSHTDEKAEGKGANILQKTMTYYQHQKYLKLLPRQMDVIYAFWRWQKPLILTALSRVEEGLDVKTNYGINILETYSASSN
jgi:hypothetical protein